MLQLQITGLTKQLSTFLVPSSPQLQEVILYMVPASSRLLDHVTLDFQVSTAGKEPARHTGLSQGLPYTIHGHNQLHSLGG